MRPSLPAAVFVLAALAAGAAAQDMGAKLCPILAEVAAERAGAIPEAVRADLVITIAGAYDYDPEALAAVIDGADAATEAACPADRAAVLRGVALPTLAEALR